MLQATEQGLDSAAATQLLVETLQYNGLPLVGGAAGGDTTAGAGAAGAAGAGAGAGAGAAAVSGLPVPGTLEHSVALAMFGAQQYLASVLAPGPPNTQVRGPAVRPWLTMIDDE